jgi:ATP-dependent DNA helicase RecG
MILALLATTPTLTIPEIANRLEKSGSAIERAIRKLRESGRLKRIGSAKTGHWQILDD